MRNCDLLIAIWDGKPGKGRGGTADTVHFAANFGPPVWWIHADRDQPPVWVDTVFDLRTPPRVDAAAASLRDHLTRLIVPPHISPPHPHSVFERVVNRLRPTPPAPFAAWLAETPLPEPLAVDRLRQIAAFRQWSRPTVDAAETAGSSDCAPLVRSLPTGGRTRR